MGTFEAVEEGVLEGLPAVSARDKSCLTILTNSFRDWRVGEPLATRHNKRLIKIEDKDTCDGTAQGSRQFMISQELLCCEINSRKALAVMEAVAIPAPFKNDSHKSGNCQSSTPVEL